MRPRFLLNLINHCKGPAITLGHERIEDEDIERGTNTYSSELVEELNYEISSILSEGNDILYVLVGQTAHIGHEELLGLLERNGRVPGKRLLMFFYGMAS